MTDKSDGDGEGPAGRPVLGGRYELGSLIGRGGMADVRAGHDSRLGRTVAVKRLRSDLASDPTFQARFRREAQASASLNHPAIVAVYDTGDEVADDGTQVPYIVMEYVDGRTLREIMREGRKILPERALEITADVLSALDYSHRAGIVHRDIKPANVMLTPTGRVKVMDFGIARAIADASSSMTATAAVVGTAQYLSPEQARGEQVDARSDIYSTGCLLFELLTGRPPFVGDNPVSVAYQHVREDPQPPSSLQPDVPPEMDAIVAKALAKKTTDRYQSAAQMRADIERALAGQEVEAAAGAMPLAAATTAMPQAADDETSVFAVRPDEDAAERDDPPRRRRRWPWLVLVLVVLLLLGGLTWLLASGGGDPAEVEVPAVVGDQVSSATAELEGLGLQVEAEREPSESPRGEVTGQDPDDGEFVPDGSTVVLTVSGGPDSVTVPPGLVGASRAEAVDLLEEARLKAEFDRAASDATRNEVLSAEPESGTEVSPKSVVTLSLSTGPVLVPSVVGETQEDAEDILAEADLTSVVRYEEADTEPGIVVEQYPQANQPAEPGDEVTLVVSEQPVQTTPPTTTETTTETTTTETTTTEPTTTRPGPPNTPPPPPPDRAASGDADRSGHSEVAYSIEGWPS